MSHARGAIALVGAAMALIGCVSPEAQRTRGGGPGADIRNRGPNVEMHAGSKMFHDVPCLLPSNACTGPAPMSGLPGDFPEPRNGTGNRK